MSFPGGSLDEVRNFLDTNHPEQYLVFNLSDKSYDTAALHGQVRACVRACVCVCVPVQALPPAPPLPLPLLLRLPLHRWQTLSGLPSVLQTLRSWLTSVAALTPGSERTTRMSLSFTAM